MPGLTTTGFQIKTLTEILADIEAKELADIDAELDISADSAVGQINGSVASKLAEIWELLDSAYGAFDEGNAEDTLLDGISALTGTYREPATKGTVNLDCALTIGTVLSTASVVGKLGDDTNLWQLKEAFTAPSTGTHSLLFESTRTGPIEALAGTLTVIKTPVAGWASATNPLAADVGRTVEEDPDLRLRRRDELRAQGSATVPGLGAKLLLVDGVISAKVFENVGMTTNVDGLPAKSFEAVVWDGISSAALDLDLWTCVYSNKPAGMQAYGDTATTFTDAYGNSVSIAFSRSEQVEITIVIQAAIRGSEFPVDGVAQIKAAIVAAGAAYGTGVDVYRLQVMAKAQTIAGVKDIPVCTLATPAIPAAPANVAISKRQIATFDAIRITVTTVEASV